MKEQEINEKQSLEIIMEMISRTRDRYIGNGNIMLLWGYLTVAVSILVWVMLVTTRQPAWNFLWFLIWIVGGIATPIMARKEQKKGVVKNYSDRITSQIWTFVGVIAMVASAMCLGFQLIGGILSWGMMLAFALIVVPFGEITQGIILKERSLTVGGFVGMVIGIFTLCCIAGRVPLYVNWYLPVFMSAFVAMFVVPGHILNHKAKAAR